MATALVPNREWTRLASDEQIERAAAALEENGMHAIVVDTGDDARHEVFKLLPDGAQVMTMTSRTLETIGVADEINEPSDVNDSRRFEALRPKLMAMDMQTQWPEMRRMGASPDWAIGSVHAVTEHGEVLAASASGSQLAAYISGAGNVIWVVGAQKIVPDRDAGFKRIYEYSFPLEDARAREAYRDRQRRKQGDRRQSRIHAGSNHRHSGQAGTGILRQWSLACWRSEGRGRGQGPEHQ